MPLSHCGYQIVDHNRGFFWPIMKHNIQVTDRYKPDIQQHTPTIVPQQSLWLSCAQRQLHSLSDFNMSASHYSPTLLFPHSKVYSQAPLQPTIKVITHHRFMIGHLTVLLIHAGLCHGQYNTLHLTPENC